MATENVTPADPPAYVFTLGGELRKLARHAEDALAMLREHEASTDRRQSIEHAVRDLVGAIEDYVSSAPRRVVATVQPARRGNQADAISIDPNRLAPVVALRDPVLLGLDLIDRIHAQLGEIPTRDLGRDEEDRDVPGATPEGYTYAPDSEDELREAVALLDRAARLLEAGARPRVSSPRGARGVMTEGSTLFHLSAGWWEAIGTWLAAGGTVGAIWSALYVARRDDRVRIRVTATVGQIAGNPAVPIERRHLWITVTNLGRRPFMLQNVAWRSGLLHHSWPFLARVYAVQSVEAPAGPNLPLKMEDGDVANWMIPLDYWLGEVSKIVAEPHWLGLRTLRIEAYASTGDVARSKVSQSLGEKIRAKLKAPAGPAGGGVRG